MLIDKTQGKLKEIILASKKMGKWENLRDKLRWLSLYNHVLRGHKKTTRCLLFTDFAPLSFYFELQLQDTDGEWKRWFNGGLIFHGNHDGFGSGSAPTFSVCLTPTDGWSIHT